MSNIPAPTVQWSNDVQAHDYPAAESYLSLLYPHTKAQELVQRLRKTDVTQFKAKDIFRASQLSLLGVSNTHVQKDSQKIVSGVHLSPLLLVRDEAHGRVVIADGYHRLCAVYAVDEDALVDCKIV
jgi:disulfide oxidoreductase YuzD